jgi:YegS/Rv2252/BmrU family lipid kinase
VTRAVLIANPNAARTQEATVKGIVRVMQQAGWSLDVLATGGPGDARRIASDAVNDGVDVVAVFGGDGTTMQAAAALVGTETILGVLPGGTGNLLAGNLRLPVNPVRAAAAMVRGTPKRLDLGRMQRPDGEHYFAVACGAGLDARVMTETTSSQKHRWGMMAYWATTARLLPDIKSVPFHITIDGQEHEAEAAMLLVANCGEVIPRLIRLGSGISPHDGLLDLVVLRSNSLGQTVKAAWNFLRDTPGVYGDDVLVAYARGKKIEVRMLDGGAEQPVQLDGEAGGQTPFSVEVVPGAVAIMMPEPRRKGVS